MRTRSYAFVLRTAVGAALIGTMFAVSPAHAQYRERYGERVPDTGTVAVGGAVSLGVPLDPSFTSGPAVTGLVEGYFSPRVSVRGAVSGAWWDITGRGFTGTVSPLALDANVVYTFEDGRVHPYVTGGVGLYRFRFAETPTRGSADKAGVDFGAGLEYFVRRRATVTAEVLFHAVNEPVQSPVTTYNSTHYWTVTVGMKRYFGER